MELIQSVNWANKCVHLPHVSLGCTSTNGNTIYICVCCTPQRSHAYQRIVTEWRKIYVDYVWSGSDYGFSLVRCQIIIWANGELLLIGRLGTNVGEIWIKTLEYPFQKIIAKVVCKWVDKFSRSQCVNIAFCFGNGVIMHITVTS